MEQKKILWIIASVGVFLLVVMGAALIINRPAQAVEPALASLQSPDDTWIMSPVASVPVQAGAAEKTTDFQTQGQLTGGTAQTLPADGAQAQEGAASQGHLAAEPSVDNVTV